MFSTSHSVRSGPQSGVNLDSPLIPAKKPL
jgi:hypothetical protein